MRNIALILMYNGTAYHGWQVQKTERTVAETLEKGLSMVCGEKIKCVGCGRTDAGVHAEHYVANFRTDSRIPVDDDHALLQLAVADELIHILRNGGGNVVLGGAVGQGFLGVDLLLFLSAEELLQLALQGSDVAVVVHTAAVLAQCRLADPHEWGSLGLADVLFLQELLHPCLQCAVIFLTHARLLHFVSLRFGSSYPDPGHQPPPSAMAPHQAAAAPIPSGMQRGRSGRPCSRGRPP